MIQSRPTREPLGMSHRKKPIVLLGLISLLAACQQNADSPSAATASTGHDSAAVSAAPTPTAEEAGEFLRSAESELSALAIDATRAAWIQNNFITTDTNQIAARTAEKYTATGVGIAADAARFNALDLDNEVRRKLNKLKTSLTLPAPQDQDKTSELATIASELSSLYGQGEYCRDNGECWSLGQMTEQLASVRDAELLEEIWVGWRGVSPPMRAQYQRMVEIANEGAVDLGYSDVGQLWRSSYDMDPDEFALEMDRLWGQVKPLYDALHCHVRAGLNTHYGDEVAPPNGPIPAHLLGNMWAQSWGNIYPLVAPQDADPGYDLTQRILDSGMSEIEMVRSAEGFFTSLGFDPLPETFWERSLFVKPADRDVVCHASAWNVDQVDDLRIKMCIQKNGEDFSTIHHELGHNFYQRAYNQQSFLFQESANDGFHEAIGDTIALSVTPKYLKQIGLIDEIPDASKDIGLLLGMALDKVAFVPFGLMVDKWRWQVFNGQTAPANYNADWWALRTAYQGIVPPVPRSESDFDPGAKYHIPGNTPYSRYFLAHILQFQFHKALCEIAGNTEPLHRCSIYGNAEAGRRLNAMLEMGSSQPWPDALETLTGTREMDASAILDYFAPLKVWLDEQNQGRECGW